MSWVFAVSASVAPGGLGVSAPASNTTSGIDSPSFSKRNISTQVTVEDGDTIAIGGIIQETVSLTSSGIPVLHRIPIIGGALTSSARMTPSEVISL